MSSTRRSIRSALLLALTAALGINVATAADLPEAAVVLDGYVDATGGLDAYQKIDNRVMKVRLEIVAQGIVLDTTLYLAKPNKAYSLIESDAVGRIEKGTDGEVVWEISTMMGPQIKEGQEKTDFLREARLDKLAYWRDLYEEVELVGIESIDDRPCYKIVGTPADGKPQTLYFDQSSNLLSKLELVIENPMGTIPMVSYLGDYAEVDGLLLPHRNRFEIMGQERLAVTESVEHNLDLPDARFELPAQIQALLQDEQHEVAERAD